MSRIDAENQIGGLCLERKIGDVILIDNGRIVIQLASINGSRARIRVRASSRVQIDRLEHACRCDLTGACTACRLAFPDGVKKPAKPAEEPLCTCTVPTLLEGASGYCLSCGGAL